MSAALLLQPRTRLSGLGWFGGLASLAGLVLLGLWAAFTMIGGAVIAQGEAAVRGLPRTIQHLDGGILSEIRVANGDTVAEGQVIALDAQHEMISSGWSNRTPWNTYREEDEPDLAKRYAAMIANLKDPRNAIFNIHVPPYKSNLDEAPELDENLRPKYAGNALKPVGSTALRAAIEKYQPLLGLHGHIHEGRGHSRIGKTLCINPGSLYEQGVLQGALVKLGKNKIESYVLTQG